MKEFRSWIDKQSRTGLSSEKGRKRVLGALIFRDWWIATLVFAIMGIALLLSIPNWHKHLDCIQSDLFKAIYNWIAVVIGHKVYWLFFISLLSALIFRVCHVLTDVFTLLKKETGITWCQMVILITIGLWIVGFIWIFELQKGDGGTILFGIAGALLVWIFQDKVKGAVTFIHLRMNHLLNIDDWIKVPKYDADGMVERVSLTTVTIYNWDTTTSTIPISALQTDHFINLQNMLGGKTYGRRMFMSFIMDTSWFHAMSEKELDYMKQQILLHDQNKKQEEGREADQAEQLNCLYLPEEEIKEGALNAHLYRLYLYHWLMRRDHVSQQPRLFVKWREPKEGGMVLQVFAFIIDSDFTAFEWQQSLIIEHIMESMEWFGLRLYQSPSAYDVSNSTIYIAEKPATYRKEEVQ